MSSLETTDIAAKLEEAAIYAEHGLKIEAHTMYREILAADDGLDPELRAEVERKVQEAAEAVIASRTGDPLHANNGGNGNGSGQGQLEICFGLIGAGFYSDALDGLTSLLPKSPNQPELHARIGECHQKMGQPEAALEHLLKANSSKELSGELLVDVLQRLADIYEKTGALQDAKKHLAQLSKILPDAQNISGRYARVKELIDKYQQLCSLVHSGEVGEDMIDRALDLSKKRGIPVETVLIEDFGVEKKKVGKAVSDYFKVPLAEFDELQLDLDNPPACINDIQERFWRSNECIPIGEQGQEIHVAAVNPHDPSMRENLFSLLKTSKAVFFSALPGDVYHFIDYFYGKYQSYLDGASKDDLFSNLELVEESDEDEGLESGEELSGSEDTVVRLANRIIEEGYVSGASDIHLESLTQRRGIHVRFRVDGECSTFKTIPQKYARPLISRIKILSKLDISERRLPQDGKIVFRIDRGRKIELRVATLPTTGGNEDVVLRILSGGDALPLKSMGMLDDTLSNFKQMLGMPYGLILVCGPTGSGKTTTLHASLGHINTPERKIWTVEDPVEIIQDGLRQVQVHSKIGLTFDRVLRAFLRADPDTIMVGETRDVETATTLIEASLTGHLVFSTLHTNSAPETVTRLLGMGMDPMNFSDALLGVMAQRLVKRLCPHCRKPYHPDAAELAEVVNAYGDNPGAPLTVSPDDAPILYRATGCTHCKNTGYKGRLAIHELLAADEGLKVLIEKNAPVIEIRKHAMENGMRTLRQDGILKCFQGDTDLKQVLSSCAK
jgi:type II secretory ATPase GspE/PulE/Tfp pilus assembly ATPase PilB-like protein